ncbi:PREDICTED: jacalin-related lectin 25-like [Camelina sativa]|uniref:Jacalin-related lectin 25-like n=1 Tax=Camelina sativa TaxID=90675 RepID=A0ABM0ZAS1_CAMSA|nr:PREDICTED: jacalin-related lectin 25-like [Camelina sativa]
MKSRNKKMFKVGPMGSKLYYNTYWNWNEKGGNMISSIYLALGKDAIYSIQFRYFQNGGHVMSKKYGSSEKGESHEIVRLNSDEYVTGLSAIDCIGITSLIIHTNQGKHGPYCDRFSSSMYMKEEYETKIDVGIYDPREFGGFFGSFDDSGKLTSIGMYVCPITRFNDAPLGSNYKVTEVTDDDDDDQPTLYQSYDDPLATVNHNGTREYQMPHDHVKAIAHKPKYEDKMSLYQSSDRLARSTNNRTLEYQMPHEFSDGYHVKPFGRTPKLKDGIFSKLGRLFICA